MTSSFDYFFIISGSIVIGRSVVYSICFLFKALLIMLINSLFECFFDHLVFTFNKFPFMLHIRPPDDKGIKEAFPVVWWEGVQVGSIFSYCVQLSTDTAV